MECQRTTLAAARYQRSARSLVRDQLRDDSVDQKSEWVRCSIAIRNRLRMPAGVGRDPYIHSSPSGRPTLRAHGFNDDGEPKLTTHP
jgi:hypothetical protein